jgi:hypothetical protein
MVILCIQAYLDRGYFWALFQDPGIRELFLKYTTVTSLDIQDEFINLRGEQVKESIIQGA